MVIIITSCVGKLPMLTGQCPDTPFHQSAGKTRKISLIKEWRNVMAEVGRPSEHGGVPQAVAPAAALQVRGSRGGRRATIRA